MKTMIIPAGLCFLLSGLGVARADVAVGVSASLVVEPTAPVPIIVPPAPPAQLPPAPVRVHYVAPAPRAVATTQVVAGGQWVFTAQYGWLYMPYENRYVLTHAAGPYAYVYYPSYGWRWLAAPWIVGSGPYPYFGARGPFAYHWYRSLSRARHPMAVHYARVNQRPRPAPRATFPVRPAHGARAVTPHAPTRATPAPRSASRPRPTLISQRSPRTSARGTIPSRTGRR
jgi:hypothetical protein